MKCSRENVCVCVCACAYVCLAPDFLENSPHLDQQEAHSLPLLVLLKGPRYPARFRVGTELQYLAG